MSWWTSRTAACARAMSSRRQRFSRRLLRPRLFKNSGSQARSRHHCNSDEAVDGEHGRCRGTSGAAPLQVREHIQQRASPRLALTTSGGVRLCVALVTPGIPRARLSRAHAPSGSEVLHPECPPEQVCKNFILQLESTEL